MSEENIEQAQTALFNYFVDTLVDLSDPEDEDKEFVQDSMCQLVTILFEGLDLQVLSEDDGQLSVRVSL